MSGDGGRRLPAPNPIPTTADDAWIEILRAVPELSSRPEALDEYTPAIRQLHAMSQLNAEVNNGGFSQFFFNGGGLWLDDAIAGFAAAGLEDHRQLTVDVAQVVIAGLDALAAAQRGGSLEAYAEWADGAGLDRFDDRWWELAALDPAFDRFVEDRAGELWDRAG